MFSEIVGWLGAFLIAVGWVPEVLTLVRKRAKPPEIRFVLTYACGSLLLVAYALSIGSWVFAFLNALAFAMAGLSYYYGFLKN